MSVYRIEIITSMYRLEDLKHVLSKIGVHGMTVVQAMGCGTQKGTYEYVADAVEEMELLPKQMIILYVEDDKMDAVIDAVKKELYTGHIGDGKIFVTEVKNIIRIRTGEEGDSALV
ncbi:MAG: P-II family nitrogen regulator [Eubacterium sp.]|nr:P-II family nitrogen regulator [Eubacterium sp.]